MSLSNLQNIFNKVLAGETVFILFTTKESYEGTRVALLRKFRNLKKLFEDLGENSPYADQFFRCNFDKELVRGRFTLAKQEEKQNNPNKLYNIEDL